MTFLATPDKAVVLNALLSGQTFSFFQEDPHFGRIDVRIYVAEDVGIVVSPLPDRNASELESQFYSIADWDKVWQQWQLEAVIRADDYTLL